MRTHTKDTQQSLTPGHALQILKEGNARFMNNLNQHRNLLHQVNETSTGQLFSIRIAGNILNEDILGSMEFACKIAGSKLIVVLGHTKCGAIAGACNNIVMGNITGLLNKVKPAIEKETETTTERNGHNKLFVRNVTVNNVFITAQKIKEQSSILKELEESGQIKIVGALYDLDTGQVIFYE
jgi:carbonic anhydrase